MNLCISSFLLVISFSFLHSNSLQDCCGLFPIAGKIGTELPPNILNLENGREEDIIQSKRPVEFSVQKQVFNQGIGPSEKFISRKITNNNLKDRLNFPVSGNKKVSNKVSNIKFGAKRTAFFGTNVNCNPILQNKQTGTVPTFFYPPRIKTRVFSPPNIDAWERSMREEMRLNGRSKQTVDRLLLRIRNYYNDQTIMPEDFAPNGPSYNMSKESRELAEKNIKRSVESLVNSLKKRKSYGRNQNISEFNNKNLLGKLAFINTQLTKLGREKVSIDDLKFVVTKKFQSSKKIDDLDIGNRNRFVKNPMAFDFKSIEFKGERKDTLKFVESIYLGFANWLAKEGYFFPSNDKEVIGRAKEVYDLVNFELNKIGKTEEYIIFEEKTIAYLEDVLDEKGNDAAKNKTFDLIIDKKILAKHELNTIENDSKHYHHLASLPGRVISKDYAENMAIKKGTYTLASGEKIIQKRLLNRLPGHSLN